MDAGCGVFAERDAIRLRRRPALTAVSLRTAPYPAFPTDMQASSWPSTRLPTAPR